MHSKPFVSIITVVYNNKFFFEKTLQSIFQQESASYEVVVIDGGSTDGTLDVILQHASNIAYWISEPDSGIYDAMNKGLAASTGQYVWFINSGDEVNGPDVIKTIMGLPAADVYYGETVLINEQGNRLGTRSELSTRKLPKNLTWESLQTGMVVSHQSILVRREIAPRYNIKYKCSADIDWVIESLKQSKIICNTHLELSRYLTGGFSIKNAKRCFNERFIVFVHHYGMVNACLYHLRIVAKALFYRIAGKSNY